MCQNTFGIITGGSPATSGGSPTERRKIMEGEILDVLPNNQSRDNIISSSSSNSNNNNNTGSKDYHRRRSVSPRNFSIWKTHYLQQVWAVHFGMTFMVLVYGAYYNGNRKYISVDPSNVPGECVRAFVDVFATSLDDGKDALICCTADQEGLVGICDRTPSYLIFAHRLAQFPEAWLLPVFPLVLRGTIRCYQFLTSTLPQGETYFSSVPNSSTTCRRITLYLVCLIARGMILYSFFNIMEQLVVPKAESSDDEPCWYKEYLKSFQTPLSGKEFDFSDHVVLYFAQLIPVALSETVYALRAPFWRRDNNIMPKILVAGLVYLYFITFLGAYKTSAYFHTPAEIFTGYGVSLLIQIPLCLLQCSPNWERSRAYFYGQPATGFNTMLISTK